jgi:hypothetical protein
MKVHFPFFSSSLPGGERSEVGGGKPEQSGPVDGWTPSASADGPLLKPFGFSAAALAEQAASTEQAGSGHHAGSGRDAGGEPQPFPPLLNAVEISPEKRRSKVPLEVLERAQRYLDRGDRGAAYLTLYQELGNEQILIQTAITTYTGFWGSGALTGNSLAQQCGGDRYSTPLDDFSVEIAQATLDAVRKDLEAGGSGRLSDDQFQSTDRDVWRRKSMPELFPGNVQFLDFWNHGEGDRMEAFFSTSTLNMIGAGLRAMIPNTSFMGLNEDGRNLNSLVGKRPAEFEGDPNYTIHGGDKDRFITVVDNRTGFIEAFWDKRPRIAGHFPLRQLPNKPIAKDSPEYRQRKKLYQDLGANRHRPA